MTKIEQSKIDIIKAKYKKKVLSIEKTDIGYLVALGKKGYPCGKRILLDDDLNTIFEEHMNTKRFSEIVTSSGKVVQLEQSVEFYRETTRGILALKDNESRTRSSVILFDFEGKIKWVTEDTEEIASLHGALYGPVGEFLNGRLWVISTDEKVLELDAETGKILGAIFGRWRQPAEKAIEELLDSGFRFI